MTAGALLRNLAFAGGLAVLSALVVRGMIIAQVMDAPNARKPHERPTPTCGGVGIVVAFLVGVFVLYRYAEFSRLAEPYFLGVIGASVLIALVSFLDDLRDWPFSVKLAAQLIAAMAAIGTGIYVRDYRLPYVGPLYVGWIGAPATLVWILFFTNAMNFIDGLNGLAAGVALIAAAFLAGIAAAHGGWFAYFAALLLVAGVIGFLPFN
ncbi:MAG: undecaprenyl/decaprenyl-phosphate alpha-N-acetylglucosaminyl 1-phosphate transferase, partial [Acetobacteraceae bacterium]